jgi:hypothetical protein
MKDAHYICTRLFPFMPVHHVDVNCVLYFLGSGTLSGESVESKKTSETDQQLSELLAVEEVWSERRDNAEKQIISRIANYSKLH